MFKRKPICRVPSNPLQQVSEAVATLFLHQALCKVTYLTFHALLCLFLRHTFEAKVCEVQPHSFLLTQRPARIEDESPQKPKIVDGLLRTLTDVYTSPKQRIWG